MKITCTPRVLTIELTEDEATTLRTLCGFVGGDMHNSRRKHTEELSDLLSALDIHPDERGSEGAFVYFNDYDRG